MKKEIGLFLSALTLAVGLLPTRAAAIDFKHQEDIGVESTWAICISSTAAGGPRLCGTSTAVSPSTWTIPGWLIDYQVQTVGGGAQFTVETSTNNGGPGNPQSVYNTYVSSTIYVGSLAPLATDVKGQMYNTKLNLNELDAGASVYIKIEYLYPRANGQP